MQPLAIDGVWMWSRWQPDRNMPFCSYFLADERGNTAFDPLPLDDGDAAEIERLGGVATVLLSNRDHARAAQAMRERFGAKILCSHAEAGLFDFGVDGTFESGSPPAPHRYAHFGPEAAPGVLAMGLNGAKTAGEVVFMLKDRPAAIVGDAVIGAPAGALSFLAAEKLADEKALALSLRTLWQLKLDALLTCDGAPLLAGADDALGALLEARGGPDVNRINLEELLWEPFDELGGKYRGASAEIGLPIGARKLGYQLVRIEPNARFCPLHSHDREEEMFYVLDGTPSVRTPRGTLVLRPGDVMAFPVGDRGTHQLLNESDAPSTVLLLGGAEIDEVAFYPDSQKVLARRRRFLMRADHLDYFDGEG